jgi:RNA polymerase sigma-70 factor (ECF subfamily)
MFAFRDAHDDDGAPAAAELSNIETPEDLALTDEITAALNSAIEGLSEDQRTAICLRELQGFSYSQVALAMSCPIGTVRSRVARARDAIDGQLRDVFDHGLGRMTAAPVRGRAVREPAYVA